MLQVPSISIRFRSLATVGPGFLHFVLYTDAINTVTEDKSKTCTAFRQRGKEKHSRKKIGGKPFLEQSIPSQMAFASSQINALDFHLNNQKLGSMCCFFLIWCPVFIWLPKISFSWPNCLSAKVYHCCFCAHLLRLTWQLSSHTWVTLRSSVTLVSFKSKEMLRVPAIHALRTE